MVQFNRVYATSYRRSAATVAVPHAVSEIFDFKEYDDLEIRVRVSQGH